MEEDSCFFCDLWQLIHLFLNERPKHVVCARGIISSVTFDRVSVLPEGGGGCESCYVTNMTAADVGSV